MMIGKFCGDGLSVSDTVLAGWLASLADDGLDSFTSDSSSELKILWHYCDSLGVDGTQVGVLKKSN